MPEVDDNFFDRADEHINLSNKHLSNLSRGKVSASMMYAVARFNSWVTACEYKSAKELKGEKEEALKYFVGEYKKMLSENLDDYINNFDKYMKR